MTEESQAWGGSAKPIQRLRIGKAETRFDATNADFYTVGAIGEERHIGMKNGEITAGGNPELATHFTLRTKTQPSKVIRVSPPFGAADPLPSLRLSSE
jgi:hypothetical protein